MELRRLVCERRSWLADRCVNQPSDPQTETAPVHLTVSVSPLSSVQKTGRDGGDESVQSHELDFQVLITCALLLFCFGPQIHLTVSLKRRLPFLVDLLCSA